MTVTITIPIFETFWALPPDIRVFIGMGSIGVAVLGFIFMCGGTSELFSPIMFPFTGFGVICIGAALLCLAHFMSTDMITMLPDNWRIAATNVTTPNFTFPINVVVK